MLDGAKRAPSAASSPQAYLANASTSLSARTKLPSTSNGIHVGLPFNWRMSAPDSEVGWVDMVWGSAFPQRPPATYNGAYFPFARDPSADPSRLAFYAQKHPDWVVYRCDRKTPAYSFGQPMVPLDFSNTDVLDFLLSTYIYPALDTQKYDGIDFDNVGLTNAFGRCGIWKTDSQGIRTWRQLYSGNLNDSHYADTVVAWATYISQHIRTHTPRVVIGVNTTVDEIKHFVRLLPFFDLIVDEKGFTTWGSKDVVDAAWTAEMQGATYVAQLGKALLLVCEQPGSTPAHTHEQIQWCLSNYLLVKGDNTYANISGFLSGAGNERKQDYGMFYPLSEYRAPIGTPTDSAHQEAGVFVRHFTGGAAYVNPSSTRSFDVPISPAKDLYGASVSGHIHLGPHSGLILLHQ